MLGDQSFLAVCFCVKYSIIYFLLRKNYYAFRPLRSFLKLCVVLFLVKVASSASRRVEKCDDIDRNLTMSLNIVHILMSNRHISEMNLQAYTYMPSCYK